LVAGAALGYGAYKGIKRIKRAKARQRARKQIGTYNKRPCKTRVLVEQGVLTVNDLTWSAVDLTQCPYGQGKDERKNDWMNLSGWRIMMPCQNTSGEPIYVVMIVASPKNYREGVTTTDEQLQEEFFRAYGTDRARDWKAGDSFNELLHHPINTDKWTILNKKIKYLGPVSGQATNRPLTYTDTTKDTNWWVPIRRQFKFESDNSEGGGTRVEDTPVYFITYAVRAMQSSGGTPQASYKRQLKIVSFFRDGAS